MQAKILAAAVVSALTTLSGSAGAQSMGVSVEVREDVFDSYIFVFRDDVAARDVGRKAEALAAAAGGHVTYTYTTAIRGFAAKLPGEAAAHLLANNPLIAAYEPDAIATAFAPPGSSGPTAIACNGPQTTPAGITRVGGGAGNTTTHTAWVIDTGIDFEHPDLNVNITKSKSFLLRGKTTADDGNGHGTHVAGTIGARDNGCDVIGVAPGASLVAVRVLDNSGSGSYSGVIKGIDYVAANAAVGDVANMSLGGPRSDTLNAAVINAAKKGIYFSIAAGNSSADAKDYSPASVDDPVANPYMYTVSAIDATTDTFAWFSNYGAVVDCAAPGVSVLSTRNGGGTTSMSGTSMAAPHVAGLLLLGVPVTNGFANNDPDGDPDPICHK